MKTEVMRVNSSEKKLINVLREDTNVDVIKEFIECTRDSNLEDNIIYSSILEYINSKYLLNFKTLDTLIADGVLTDEQSDYLLTSIRSGKSVVIEGGYKVGKNMLLTALLYSLEDFRTLVKKETAELYNYNDTMYNSIINALKKPVDLFIVPELVVIEDVQAILTNMVLGVPFITTTQLNQNISLTETSLSRHLKTLLTTFNNTILGESYKILCATEVIYVTMERKCENQEELDSIYNFKVSEIKIKKLLD